jgi:phage replication O-like protein O
MATDNQPTFPGFQFPNTTQIPNEVFDTLMPHLSGGELKVLLYICRRTFGFRKDRDSISLTQIAHGITTKAGRVLDQGTGLSKRHVINALKALEKRNIITVTRKVDETGLNEVNTYSLNMLAMGGGVGTKSPQGVVNSSSPGVVHSPSPGVVNASAPTKQREQKKERQKKDIVVAVVAQDLEHFGIAQPAATKLLKGYPVEHIKEKLEMAKGLVADGSRLVFQNPAGWLRRAIEEDYSPPRTYHRSRHKTREAKGRKTVQAEPRATSDIAREQRMPTEEPQRAQNIATESEQTVCTESVEYPQNVATQYRDNQAEQKELEKTSRENETVWNNALEQVKKDLPISETEDRLAGTTLIAVTDTKAVIGVPNRFAIPWLERRLYGQIAKAIKGVVGKDLDLQFVPAS